MSNLYIQVQNSIAVNHPAYEENLVEAFGSVPLNWKAFIRIPAPTLGAYDKYDTSVGHGGCEYKATENGFTDCWHVVAMTDAEKVYKQNIVKAEWLVEPNWASWLFNETTCAFEPPIERPLGGYYEWDEPTVSWVAFTSTTPTN
jgi:hypothetical protein